MQFINKQSGEIHFAHNKEDIKSYQANQSWEEVKEAVKTPKEEPKEKKEKKSIIDKIFKD